MNVKDHAIGIAASNLRMSESQVRVVVDEFDRVRAQLSRAKKTGKPKAVGGGWYLMPDGSKVRGKAAAGLA